MLTALTHLAALNVPAKVDLREMESTAQVSPTVRKLLFQVLDYFILHFLLPIFNIIILFIDINECASDNDCDENANCFDSIGSYNCSCNPGYWGNGFNCTGWLKPALCCVKWQTLKLTQVSQSMNH